MELGGVAHLDLSGERKEEGKRDEGISPDRHRIAPLQARRAGVRQGREGAGRGERCCREGGKDEDGGLLVSDRHYLSDWRSIT